MGRIKVYKRIGDVFAVVGETDSAEFEWLIDEDDMEIVAIYIIDELEKDHTEERKVYEYRAEF